jgi:hypothetical protein
MDPRLTSKLEDVLAIDVEDGYQVLRHRLLKQAEIINWRMEGPPLHAGLASHIKTI